MKRYLLIAVVVALLGAACSGSSEIAATVNGVDIETSAVGELIFEPADDLTDEEYIQLLDILVQWKAIADTAKSQFGIDPTDEQIAAEIDRLVTEQGAGMTFEEFLETQNISEDGLDLYAAQLLIGEEVLNRFTADLSEPTVAEAQQLLTDDPYNWTEVCAAHILVASDEEATAVLSRLAEGDEFAAVAVELSLDSGSGAAGGDLGCAVPSGYVEPFADATMTAAIGEVVGPIESQFGFHLIRVDSRTEATIEELQAAVADTGLSQAIDDWYVGSIAEAEITIAEAYGTWGTDPFPGIVPPTS